MLMTTFLSGTKLTTKEKTKRGLNGMTYSGIADASFRIRRHHVTNQILAEQRDERHEHIVHDHYAAA